MTQPPNKEHREIIQRYVDQACGRFKDIVKSGRPAFRDNAALDELATGEIFAAPVAAENGLVDEIGFIEDAIDRVLELAGLDKSTTRVVRYKGRATLCKQSALPIRVLILLNARSTSPICSHHKPIIFGPRCRVSQACDCPFPRRSFHCQPRATPLGLTFSAADGWAWHNCLEANTQLDHYRHVAVG